MTSYEAELQVRSGSLRSTVPTLTPQVTRNAFKCTYTQCHTNWLISYERLPGRGVSRVWHMLLRKAGHFAYPTAAISPAKVPPWQGDSPETLDRSHRSHRLHSRAPHIGFSIFSYHLDGNLSSKASQSCSMYIVHMFLRPPAEMAA